MPKPDLKQRPPPAKQRKAQKEAEEKQRAKKAAEDASWEDNCKPKKSQVKHAMKAIARDQSLYKKQELKRLQAEEERSISRKPKGKAKLTQYSILQEKQRKDEERRHNKTVNKLQQLNITPATAYKEEVDQGNRNRNGAEQAESGIDAALMSTLSGKDKAAVEMLTRAGLSASALHATGIANGNGGAPTTMNFKIFEDQRMAGVKEQKPGLRASQYRDIIKKEWQRSELNPKNAAS